MTSFLKYPSLSLPTVDTFRRLPDHIASMKWYATEKLHGTNVSVVMDTGDNIMIYNRTTELKKEENVKVIKRVLGSGLKAVMQDVMAIYNVERIHVYGELFGAGIMKMNYTLNENNQKDFKVFSVFLYNGDEIYTVLPLSALKTYFVDHLAPIEAEGTLYEMMCLDRDAVSNFGGQREGYVIMPVEHVVYDTTLPTPFYNAIKVKYGKYAEKSRARKFTKKERSISEGQQKILDALRSYVTESRVLNVVSHDETELDKKNIGKLIPRIKIDIIDDYCKDYDEETVDIKLMNLLTKDISNSILGAISNQ